MKKFTTILAVVFLSTFLVAGSAMALPFGGSGPGAALQTVFDNITVGGPSSVDVTTDYISDESDSTWHITATGGSVSTIVIELANFADNNLFGVYNNGKKVQIFGGSAVAGNQATLSIAADGSVYVNTVDTGIDFDTTNFGYYLDSSYYSTGGVFYSNSDLNADGYDHMAAYEGTGDQVEIPPWAAGEWTENEYILAFEDLIASAADWDYTDFVVMVESVQPVPEPATMLLLGAGLIGLAGASRKKLFKK